MDIKSELAALGLTDTEAAAVSDCLDFDEDVTIADWIWIHDPIRLAHVAYAIMLRLLHDEECTWVPDDTMDMLMAYFGKDINHVCLDQLKTLVNNFDECYSQYKDVQFQPDIVDRIEECKKTEYKYNPE